MAIQLNRNQIKDAAINASKLDLTTGTYNFASTTLQYKTPTSDSEVAIKSYVDSVINGLNWKDTCRGASTSNLNGTYNNGTNGVGATLTVGGGITVDTNVLLRQNDRVLLKSQTNSAENGIYSMTTDGGALGASGDVTIAVNADLTQGAKGRLIVEIVSNGDLVNNTSNLVLEDFAGNSTTIVFGDASDVAIGADASTTAASLESFINGITQSGARTFQASASSGTVTIYFASAGLQASTRNGSSNAMAAFELNGGTSSPAAFFNGSSGDKITFTKADDSTQIFECVSPTPGRIGNQFDKGASSAEETALSLQVAVSANPDFSARIINDQPTKVEISLATTGTGGNGKAIAYSLGNAGCITGDTSFSGGQALGGNSILTRTSDFDISSEIASAAVFIEEGNLNGDNGFTCTTNQPIQVGVTDLAFVQFNGAGQVTAGDGLTKSGNTLSVDVDGSTLSVSATGVKVADSGIFNTQINASAAIAYSKLNLSSSILNSDINASAAIAYSKLNLTGGIVDADINSSASIADSKLATIASANKVSGSAVQLGTNSGLEDDTGLKISLDGASLALGVGGLSIAASGVSTAAIADDAVTFAKMQNVAANSLLIRNANSSGELTELALATTEIMIGDGSGMVAASLGGDVTMDNAGSVTIADSAITAAKINSSAVETSKINDAAVTFAKVGFAPYIDNFSPNGSTSAFVLSNDITVSAWLLGAIVSRNGQILKRVASSPADDSEYTIASSGGSTTVTLGGNPSSGELMQVSYYA